MLLLASCRQPEEPIRFSVLGDSYSTFQGYVSPSTNDVWYPHEMLDVTEPYQMWWWMVADSTGWQLERNNSFSGSFVCNMDFLDYFGPHSFLRRMDDLGNPDVIFVFGGANDAIYDAPLGEFVFDDWTEEQLLTFRPAAACLLSGLKDRYPKARLLLLVDLSLEDAIVASLHRIASHYQVECVDLYDIDKIWNHPTVMGQSEIAMQVLEAL